jgi:predicted transcriptional regulator YheO
VIAESFGRSCEVTLHDLRHPDASIIAISGKLSARNVGAPVNEISKWLLAQGKDVPERRNALIQTGKGRTLKSTAVLLRDREGKAFGVFCINLDVTELGAAAILIGELVGIGASTAEPQPFTDDITHVVQAVVLAEEARLGGRLHIRSRADRLTVFAALQARGVFSLRRAVPRLAEYFGISRATIYTDLTEIRREQQAKAPMLL